MKVIISRKVTFKGDEKGKADSIINQYVVDGNVEDTQHLILCLLDVLNLDFTQSKERKNRIERGS